MSVRAGCRRPCLLLCLLSLVCPGLASMGCNFPDFMHYTRVDDSKRDWRTHLMEGSHHPTKHNWEIALGFFQDSMRSSVVGGMDAEDRPHPFTRECLLEVNGRFLVRHLDHGPEQDTEKHSYMCMEFILRTEDVVQLRESRMGEHKDPRLCSDKNMKLNPWVLLNMANFSNSKVACPLTGGYNTKIYDKALGLDVCGGYDGATRLESECMSGEGMVFQYRMDICVPQKMHMGTKQRVFCAATWEVDGYIYTILRRDKSRHAWCMQIPAQRGNAFITHLFRDVRCEEEEGMQTTDRYLRMVLRRDSPRSLSDLCMDDYAACNTWKSPCIHAGSFMQLTCAKRCGICSSERPSTCTLPSAIKGKWFEQQAEGQRMIEMNDMHLSVQGYPDFRCIQWFPRPYEHDVREYEQMFVATFENGCRPRYTCAEFKKHSPSVLKYRLSQSETWPWEGTTGVVVNCQPFKYKEDDQGALFHSRHLKVLITDVDERVYVDCHLPYDIIKIFVAYKSGVSCDGALTQGPATRLRLNLDGCPDLPEEQTFGCLDSSKHGYLSDRIIVTEALSGGSSQLLCWMFPMSPDDTFFLLPIEECNEGAKARISSGQIQPLATFTYQPPTTTTSTTIMVEVFSSHMVPAGERTERQGGVQEAPYRVDAPQSKDQMERDAGMVNDGGTSGGGGGGGAGVGVGSSSGASSTSLHMIPLSASTLLLFRLLIPALTILLS